MNKFRIKIFLSQPFCLETKDQGSTGKFVPQRGSACCVCVSNQKMNRWIREGKCHTRSLLCLLDALKSRAKLVTARCYGPLVPLFIRVNLSKDVRICKLQCARSWPICAVNAANVHLLSGEAHLFQPRNAFRSCLGLCICQHSIHSCKEYAHRSDGHAKTGSSCLHIPKTVSMYLSCHARRKNVHAMGSHSQIMRCRGRIFSRHHKGDKGLG